MTDRQVVFSQIVWYYDYVYSELIIYFFKEAITHESSKRTAAARRCGT